MMSNAEYLAVAEALYTHIEEIIDGFMLSDDIAIDYENCAGVITIDCEDTDTKVIISRQQATQQIWVAAKSGGFHCVYDEGKQWRCTKTQETLGDLLTRVCTEQSSQPVPFNSVDAL